MKKNTEKKSVTDIMRFKWLANDCNTFDEVINALKERIEEIEQLKLLGCKIVENNDDDYVCFEIPNEKIDEYCKMYEVDRDELYEEEEDDDDDD